MYDFITHSVMLH